MQEPPSDADIARDVSRGEVARFELLMRRYNALVYRVARSVLRDDHDAEECSQRAWLLAFERIGQFAEHGAFAGWVGRITHRKALEMIRARSRKAETSLEGVDQTSIAGEIEPTTPEVDALRRDLRRRLESAIDSLPTPLREAYILREVHGLSAEEAGRILGLTTEHVRVRVHRAKLRLRSSSDLESYAGEAFAFDGVRCDRIVARVLSEVGLPRSRTS